eukprot:1409445-Rhodomonas_salina.2
MSGTDRGRCYQLKLHKDIKDVWGEDLRNVHPMRAMRCPVVPGPWLLALISQRLGLCAMCPALTYREHSQIRTRAGLNVGPPLASYAPPLASYELVRRCAVLG